MNVRRVPASLITAIVIGSVALACMVPTNGTNQESISSSDTAVAQGYPPPGGTYAPPTPTATPSTDPMGYFPPPVGRTDRIESLAGSMYSDLLVPLQEEFDARSSDLLVERVTERFGVTLYDVAHLDSEGGTSLDSANANAVLDDFFEAESSPLIQGYFESGDAGARCLVVVASRFMGTVEHPGAADPEPYGPRPPSHISADSTGFGLCEDSDREWLWQDWAYGGYHQIVERIDDARGASGWRYVVIRP